MLLHEDLAERNRAVVGLGTHSAVTLGSSPATGLSPSVVEVLLSGFLVGLVGPVRSLIQRLLAHAYLPITRRYEQILH